MTDDALPAPATSPAWPLWQRIAFRFFCIYLVLQIQPWGWFGAIPGVSFVLRPYYLANDWAVHWFNDHVAHVADTLVPVNGSGDTSWAWSRMYLILAIAAIGTVVWSLVDARRPHYARAGWWLRLVVRWYVLIAALSYGIIKLFLLQMTFPALSQLATPLGDLLPMRFEWLIIGYSDKYQFFSGFAETLAGVLLLWRPTITLGLIAAAGAFANVFMINVAYDVPVKHYSAHLLLCSMFLLAWDAPRLIQMLVLNRGGAGTGLYDLPAWWAPWKRWVAYATKALFLWQFLITPVMNGWNGYKRAHGPQPVGVLPVGVYDVRKFVVGKTEVPLTSTDTLRWRDLIIDNAGGGSVGARDGAFWVRYGRGYFRYKADTAAKTMAVWKTSTIPRDSTFMFTMRYEKPDSLTVRLHTVIRGDSVHVELAKTNRHFQLAERQFHWLSEYNR